MALIKEGASKPRLPGQRVTPYSQVVTVEATPRGSNSAWHGRCFVGFMETTSPLSVSSTSTSNLAELQCDACAGDQPPLEGRGATEYLHKLNEGWHLVDGHHLQKTFEFDDFAQALSFTNKVGVMAEANHHHPEVRLSWGRVDVLIWTHAAGGLTVSDFVLAAKVDQIE